VNARVDPIHYFLMGGSELARVATPLPSTPGLDAVANRRHERGRLQRHRGRRGYGRGVIHLADGSGGFDGGRDLAQLGYVKRAARRA
jgi:hypothetical protein